MDGQIVAAFMSVVEDALGRELSASELVPTSTIDRIVAAYGAIVRGR